MIFESMLLKILYNNWILPVMNKLTWSLFITLMVVYSCYGQLENHNSNNLESDQPVPIKLAGHIKAEM